MAQKQSSLDIFLASKNIDEALANSDSNEARIQILNSFLESVEHLHETLKSSLLHRDELIGTMTEREIMEVARVNYKQTTIRFSDFNLLHSLEDQRLWLPPRIVRKHGAISPTRKPGSTNYFDRHVLVTEEEIDADMRDFDTAPDICSSDEVLLQNANIEYAEDYVTSSSRWLRREFVMNALRMMPQLTDFIVSHNFSLVELPVSMMHVAGRTLKLIDVSFNQLSEIPLSLLANFHSSPATPAFPQLERLVLNNNRIGPFIPSVLFRADFAPHLRSINLENNRVIGFTSLLLNALKRGTLVELECANNDFPIEDTEFADVSSSISRAAESHHQTLDFLNQFSASAIEDVSATRMPICLSALRALEFQASQYDSLIAEGRAAEADMMCVRCGVCGASLFESWAAFSEEHRRVAKVRDAEPSFFDEDEDDDRSCRGSDCTIIDSAVFLANTAFWLRKVIDELRCGVGTNTGGENIPFNSPPIPLYRHYNVLGQSAIPVIFYTCGAPACVDEVVDIVGGDSDGLTDFRRLAYGDEDRESSLDSCCDACP